MPDKDLYVDICPFTYIGSTLGNALYSGLSLEDVFRAVESVEAFREGKRMTQDQAVELFDAAVSARIRTQEIKEKKT